MGLFDDVKSFVGGPAALVNSGIGGNLGSIGSNASGLGEGAKGLFGEISGANATRDAIEAQRQASQEANQTLRYMYDTQRADLQPWRDAGASALGDLKNPDFQKDFTMSDFQADPGYAFRMAEGQKAIARASSAKGLFSTGTLKSLSDYNQNSASQEYQGAYDRFNNDRTTRFNRLSSMAGIGQTATGQLGSATNNYGQGVSANQIGMGNGIASANIAQGNRVASLAGQGAGAAAIISDERLKTDIEPISKEDLAELRSVMKPYKFKYISEDFGSGDWVGVMAQDLEKSKLGKTLVSENEKGHKQIDLKKVMSLFLATMAEG